MFCCQLVAQCHLDFVAARTTHDSQYGIMLFRYDDLLWSANWSVIFALLVTKLTQILHSNWRSVMPGQIKYLLLFNVRWCQRDLCAIESRTFRASLTLPLSHPSLSSSLPPSLSVTAILTSCDFNQESTPFCQFQQDSMDNSDWTRHTGATPTPGTGPPGDYPDGSE